MKFVVVLCSLVALVDVLTVSALSLKSKEWKLFKKQFNKTYSSLVEEQFRLKVFVENGYKIQRHNDMYENGGVSYKLAMNHYGDLLHSEFLLSMKAEEPLYIAWPKYHLLPVNSTVNTTIPSAIDWRTRGAVTEVKNQGECGSCWAFSAIGALEGQHFLKTGKLVSLSEQNLVDCSTADENTGCRGGYVHVAYEYVKNNGGINTESSYPYEAKDGKCRYIPENSGANCSDYNAVPRLDEEAMRVTLATVGPISVSIDASHPSFQFYSSGVFSEKFCNPVYTNHALLAVGYDTEGELDYWLLKNSWGRHWGIEGYMKMVRHKNMCGISTFAAYPIV